MISTQSFEILVQQVYQNYIVFSDLPPTEIITVSIEFTRLVDIVSLIGIESIIAEYIRQIILANRPTQNSVFANLLDKYTYYLRLEYIRSGVLLLKEHSVQKILISIAIKGYLLYNYSKNFKETQELLDFVIDLLREVGITLESLESEKQSIIFEDTFSRQRINLNSMK